MTTTGGAYGFVLMPDEFYAAADDSATAMARRAPQTDQGEVCPVAYLAAQPEDGGPHYTGVRILEELIDTSREDMARMAQKIQSVAWVTPEDADLVASSNGRLQPPEHPDGDRSGTTANFDRLVPRQSAAEADAYLKMVFAAMPENVDPQAFQLTPDEYAACDPSPRKLAEMPAATAADLSDPSLKWIFAIDPRARELSIHDMTKPGEPFGEPYATVSLDDRPGMIDLTERLRAGMAQAEPPYLPDKFKQRPAIDGKQVIEPDGRPDGWPRRGGTIKDVPDVPSRPVLPVLPLAGDSSAGRGARDECGSVDTADRSPCQQKRPIISGEKCAAGHTPARRR